jgi:hypothetical protein
VDALFGSGWADIDDDLDALLRSDILCDPFDLIIDAPSLTTQLPAVDAQQQQQEEEQLEPPAAVAVAAPDVLPAEAVGGAAESDGSAGGAAAPQQPGAAAAAAAAVAPEVAAAAPAADGGACFAGSRPCSPRCGADGGGTPAAAAAAASVVTPGGGAWSAAPAGGRRAASPAVSSGANAAVQSPLQTCVQARTANARNGDADADGIVYDKSPLLPPFGPELAAQMAAAFGSPAPPAAPAAAASAGALPAAPQQPAAQQAQDAAGDVLLVCAGALAPQALIHAATDGLPGGGWETASYTSVVPAHDAASAAAADDGGAAAEAATLDALRRAAADVRARWPAVARVVLAKRVGGAPPGEVSVVVAVTSPSWAASIAAVTFAVARVKAAGQEACGDVAPMEH